MTPLLTTTTLPPPQPPATSARGRATTARKPGVRGKRVNRGVLTSTQVARVLGVSTPLATRLMDAPGFPAYLAPTSNHRRVEIGMLRDHLDAFPEPQRTVFLGRLERLFGDPAAKGEE